MKIGNIVSQTNIDLPSSFNLVRSVDDIIVDLPTIIIGFDLTNKLFPDFDVSNMKIKDGLYWTTKKTEKRDKYEEELDLFISMCYQNLIKNVSYIFVDPLQYKSKVLFKIVRKIYSLKHKVAYQKDGMIYIYSNKLLFGIDLKLLKFIGFDLIKIKDKIISLCDEYIEGDSIYFKYKKHINYLNNNIRYIPFLHYSFQKEELFV